MSKKNQAAVELGKLRAEKGPSMAETGRLGGKATAAVLTKAERRANASKAGLKGGAARSAALTPERRKEIARNAALAKAAKVKARKEAKE